RYQRTARTITSGGKRKPAKADRGAGAGGGRPVLLAAVALPGRGRRRCNSAGRGADTPQEIPAKGWKDIAKRTGKEVKADQVPLLAAGVAFYVLLALFPAIIAGVSIYGLVADPQTVRDQINQLAQTLSP